MLLQTPTPMLDVAVAAGFTSASHFSRCYRAAFGHKPSDERDAAWQANAGGAGFWRPSRRVRKQIEANTVKTPMARAVISVQRR